MLCELLVIAEGPDRGQISHWQPAPAEWGGKEGPPMFAVVEATVPAGLDVRQYRWDFGRQALVAPDGHSLRGGTAGPPRFAGEDDPPVRLPGKLAVCACHFNPAHFARRQKVFHEFSVAARSQGADLWVIEGVADDRADLVTIPGAHLFQCSMPDVLWQKERLLNVLIDQLPPEYDKLAWVDSDVLFDNPNWLSDTAALLERVPVAQLFERAIWLDRHGSPVAWEDSGVASRDSFARNQWLGRPFAWARAQTGLAWAARRSVLEACGGLYDQHVLGSGDVVIAFGFAGQLERPWYGNLPASMIAAAAEWSGRALSASRGVLGFVGGEVRHLWHGDRKDRQYIARHALLREHDFHASAIRVGRNGLWEWTDAASPALKEAVRRHFDDRREDG